MRTGFKKTFRKFCFIALCVVYGNNMVIAQSLSHPHIWATEADKQKILYNIDHYEWAESLFSQYKKKCDAAVNRHKTDPSRVLKYIPEIPSASQFKTEHIFALRGASDAAIVYYLTGNTDCAQYAADILNHYTQRLSQQESRKYTNGTGLIFSDWWLESRSMYPRLAIIYDFIYDFVNNSDNTVFDLETNTRLPFDNNAAQVTVKLLADVVFKSIDLPQSKHSVLAGNGALFNLMMIDDDATRESFFQRFYTAPNNEGFDAFMWTLGAFTEQNIWNETFAYSKITHEQVIQSLNVIDRFKPDLDVINKNSRIFDGFALYENYYYPSGGLMRFGDNGVSDLYIRGIDPGFGLAVNSNSPLGSVMSYGLTESENDLIKGYQWILHAATRKNMPEYAQKAKQALKFKYHEMGGYNYVNSDNIAWWSPLQLLWGINIEDTVKGITPKAESTLHVEHAGILIQRNFNTANNENDGLMYYSGGAAYVNSHSTGIDLELYGKGYVLGAESGSIFYGTDEHDNYRTRLAAHNTVIVNGSGKSGAIWDSRMNNVELEACEPLSYEAPISSKLSFSTQYINDTHNSCKQQRTVSIIRTGPKTGYYFDLFRSKANNVDNFHDYIYHNIGDAVSLKYADNTAVPLSLSTKYLNDSSGSVTGWKFFESVQSSSVTNKAVKATFALNTVNTCMNVFMPAGVDREYATALSPKTKGLNSGYDNKKTPVITIRQNGEAWNRPFVSVFEPSSTSESTIQSVENIELDGKVLGAVVVSRVVGKVIKDYIISLEKEGSVYFPEHFIGFKGRFGIIRIEPQSENTEKVTLYIGKGNSIRYADLELYGGETNKNVKIQNGVEKINPNSRFTVSTEVFGGGGTLSKSPNQDDYPLGTQVVVTATPGLGYVFDKWFVDASGVENTDTLMLFSNKHVMATFRPVDYFTLNVTSENGKVTQSEEGNEFPEQSCIDLTAVPDKGYVFDGWSGDLTAAENPITVCVNENQNITANFKLATYVSDVLSKSIVVSPNPSNGLLVVHVLQANTWSLYDISGKMVKKGNSDGSFELDVTAEKKSVYLLKISTDRGVAVKQILIR